MNALSRLRRSKGHGALSREEIVGRVLSLQPRSENQLQNWVVRALRPLENPGVFRVVHVPNGGRRKKREAAQMKNRGVRAGFPDLMVLTFDKIIFIELKMPKGDLSADQIVWHALLESLGHPVHVATSVDEVFAILRAHNLKV